jgi:hypothetical protein
MENKICEFKINDIASVEKIIDSLMLNNYIVKSQAIYKEYPYNSNIDYFKLEVFEIASEKNNEKKDWRMT